MTGGGGQMPQKGVVASDDPERNLRSGQVAEDAVYSLLPKNEAGDYESSVQHLGPVDIDVPGSTPKQYYQIGLKHISGGNYIPQRGVIAGDTAKLRAGQVAENAVFATLPEAERNKYVATRQHIGPVDIDADAIEKE